MPGWLGFRHEMTGWNWQTEEQCGFRLYVHPRNSEATGSAAFFVGVGVCYGFIDSADVRADFAGSFRTYPSHQRQKIYQRWTVRLGVEDVSQAVYHFRVGAGVFLVEQAADIGFHHRARDGIGAAIGTIWQLGKYSNQRNRICFDKGHPTLLDFLGIVIGTEPFTDCRCNSRGVASAGDKVSDFGPGAQAFDFRRDSFLSLDLFIKALELKRTGKRFSSSISLPF